jgi:glucose-1-phosphate thymidylyltransferase
LGLAEYFAAGEPVAVILGDNIFQDRLAPAIEAFRGNPSGALIMLKEVDDPERFGVAKVEGDRVLDIVEKPTNPDSRLAVTGCYLYDARVFDIIKTLAPSGRGELEITDVNNRYIEWGAMRHHVVDGWWTDAGTVASLHRAADLVASDQANSVLTVSAVP